MSKQEDIMEHIATQFAVARQEGALRRFTDGKSDAMDLMDYLRSQGMVIKVGDIEEIVGTTSDPEAYSAYGVGVSSERSAPTFRMFKEAGYVATEPLILL